MALSERESSEDTGEISNISITDDEATCNNQQECVPALKVAKVTHEGFFSKDKSD